MGTWQLANDPGCWVGADLEESYKSLFRFVELGGNFIDTAWIYGWDDKNPNIHPSEEMIGKFLKEGGKRNDLIIASKVPPKNMKWPAWKGIPVSDMFPNDWIEKCVEDSLRSLGTDHIDLMQFHVWQDDFMSQDDWMSVVEKTVKSGKVRFWGISVNDYQPSNCLKTLDTGLFSTIQFIFNVFHQKPEDKLLPYAKEKNIGLIARVPLDEGGLTGKLTEKTSFTEGDFRQKYFSGDRLAELVKRTNVLKGVSSTETTSLVDLSLRWILSHEEISTVIPGMRKTAYVNENLSILEKTQLSGNLLNELKKHVWERNFYPNHDPSMEAMGYVEI